jgi:molybdopterin synthase catalytic subunit
MLFLTMQVRVIPFGILKEWLSPAAATVELPEGATVGSLLEHLRARLPENAPEEALRGIAVGVNAEYAQAGQILHDGDEVGLLPPVSGGSASRAGAARTGTARPANLLDESSAESNVLVALTREAIDASRIVAAAKSGEDGAVVVFDGIVRNHSRGRRTLHLDYEAYEEMAVRQMRELGGKARERFGVRQVTMVHRLGRLEIGETSVLIVVASAHRSAAFEACRWLIDTVKQTVPIWKKETFSDGAVWAPGEPFPGELGISEPESAQSRASKAGPGAPSAEAPREG